MSHNTETGWPALFMTASTPTIAAFYGPLKNKSHHVRCRTERTMRIRTFLIGCGWGIGVDL